MATYYWTGTTSAAFGTATNWTPNGTPTTGDTVIFDGRATRAIDGSNQSAVTLAALYHYRSCTYDIASAATPLQVGATICRIGIDPNNGTSSSGPSVIALNFGSVQTAVTVDYTRPNGSSGLPVVLLTGTHASNTLHLISGLVGVGVATPGEASTFATVTALSGTMTVGSNVTLTTVTNRGAAIVSSSTIPTLSAYAGTTTLDGVAKVSTAATLYANSTLVLNGRPASGATAATLNLRGGTLDCSQDNRALTVTTLSDGGGTIRLSDPAQLTVTTPQLYWDTKTVRQTTVS